MHKGWLALALGLVALSPDSVSAQAPAGITVDDVFTFFTLENNSGSVGGNPVDEGWSLEADFRVYGSPAPRSAFRFVVKQGARTLGQSSCEGRFAHPSEAVARGPQTFFVSRCRDRAQRIRETGDLTVEVHLLDDGDDSSTLLRTHRIRVLTATRVRGTGQPDAPHHYVDRNSEILTSVLHLQHSESAPYMGDLTRSLEGFSGFNGVTLMINTHPSEVQRSIPSNTHFRCTVDGQRIEIPQDQVTGSEIRSVRVTHTRGEGRRDRGEYEDVSFRQYVLRVPLSFRASSFVPTFPRFRAVDEADPRVAALDAHPGLWECQWRQEREVLRTFRWRVGADGRPVPHPEQAAGLGIGPNAILVETVVPAAGAAFDARVHRASVEQGAFYGLGFRSSEGRAMVAALPNVGTPAPPQPRAGSDAARGRAAARTRRR